MVGLAGGQGAARLLLAAHALLHVLNFVTLKAQMLCSVCAPPGSPHSQSTRAPLAPDTLFAGSNMMAHYLGVHAADPPPFAAAICVSNGWDMEKGGCCSYPSFPAGEGAQALAAEWSLPLLPSPACMHRLAWLAKLCVGAQQRAAATRSLDAAAPPPSLAWLTQQCSDLCCRMGPSACRHAAAVGAAAHGQRDHGA